MANASRSQTLIVLAFIAVAAVVMAVLSMLDFSSRDEAAEIGQIVLPRFEADVSRAEKISVTTSEESYSLTRDGESWLMEEKGSYPIQLSMLADLSEALAAMTYSREMTSDPRKFDQLGLGDPNSGGSGALLNVLDVDGEQIVDLIVGFKNGDVFVRHPDETRAWAVETTVFPPLQRAARWLDLDIIQIEVANIAQVEIRSGDDPPYSLIAIPDAPGEFSLGPPYEKIKVVADYAPNAPATALSGFSPVDVVPMEEFDASRSGEHRVYTHDGLVIHAELLIDDAGKFWIAFSEGIEAETPEASAKLEAIEARVAGWAFEITRLDYSVLQTRLSELVAEPEKLFELEDG